MPRSGNVALYFGLGAYRVGTGDGGANEDSTSQWNTGNALAKQVETLRAQGAGGWALYRYGSLFGSAAPEQAAAEREALAGQTPEPGQNFGENRPKATRNRGFLL